MCKKKDLAGMIAVLNANSGKGLQQVLFLSSPGFESGFHLGETVHGPAFLEPVLLLERFDALQPGPDVSRSLQLHLGNETFMYRHGSFTSSNKGLF